MTTPSDFADTPRAKLERILSEAAGIALSSVLGRDVEAGLHSAASLLGISRDTLLSRLDARDPASIVALLESVLVHESHFFRHPEQFDALKDAVFAHAPRARPLSLWSAGCAAGEEAYTLAMALAEAGREHCRDRIVATDLSMQALAAAREAVYGSWALRQLSAARRMRFFQECAAQLVRVSDPIRQAVEFRVHELVNDPAPGEGFDVVTCRNVLVYLDPGAAARVLRRLVAALAPGGFLVLAPAELGFARELPLEKAEVGGALLLRKPLQPLPTRTAAVRGWRDARGSREAASAPRLDVSPRHGARASLPRRSPSPLRAPGDAAPSSAFEEARAAARRGEIDVAERLAREVAEREQRPDAYLLVAAVADARGDLPAAVEATKRALYLDPRFAQAHAALVSIFVRLGRVDDARRARRNAIALLEGLEDPVSLPGVEEITVGALRAALREVQE